jgi:phosphinothricin acetyltransferase
VPASSLTLRDASPADLPRIFAIYNHEVEHGIATFDVEPRVPGEDHDWLTGRASYHPVMVAEEDGEVVGWASIGPWSPRGAYRRTGEVSVYVDESARGRGTGRLLLETIVDRARDLPEIHVLLARVALPNPASIAVHEAVGFSSFGIQRRCGEKLGHVLDVNLMDLHLD